MTTPFQPITPAPLHALLVPLDGSRLAEGVLPAALALGQALPASVTLFHVLERDAPEEVHGEPHLTTHAEAAAYLEAVAQRFVAAGVAVSIHVHDNPEHDVAGSIVAHVAEFGIGLVVLATHGRGGLRGLLFGSIAQQIVRRGRRPVFLVQVKSVAQVAQPFVCTDIAVALDGTPQAETALPATVTLARAFAAHVNLIYAVPTLGTERSPAATLVPGATRALLDLEERNAVHYLDTIAHALAAAGLNTDSTVARGDPVTEVVDIAERHAADLLVLATHGRAGLGGLWASSVTAKILGRFSKPFLLVRIPENGDGPALGGC